MTLLELSNISYIVKDKSIIHNVSLSVNQGDYITIVGPSGSGKSTLLKLCSDLISPTSGTITYNGRPLTAIDPESYRKEVGILLSKTLFVCENSTSQYSISLRYSRFRTGYESYRISL